MVMDCKEIRMKTVVMKVFFKSEGVQLLINVSLLISCLGVGRQSNTNIISMTKV